MKINALRALRHRNFRLFFCGQSVSLIGTWMTRLATSWLVYRLTRSSFLLGVVTFAGQVPTFLLGPVAGVWADRWDRRRVLIMTAPGGKALFKRLKGVSSAQEQRLVELLESKGLFNPKNLLQSTEAVVALVSLATVLREDDPNLNILGDGQLHRCGSRPDQDRAGGLLR